MTMNVQERVFVVTWKIKGMKNYQIREKFERMYVKSGPTDKAIRELFNKFMRTGSVVDEKRTGRPKRSEESIELVREAFEKDPELSIRRASSTLSISQTTIFKILTFDLHKKAYRIQVLHNLHEEDYPRRSAMCAYLIDQIQSANLLDNILFSDEATFHMCGKNNRHNCRIWGNEKPKKFITWQRDSPKVNVWLGITKLKAYGPFFFQEATITGTVYLDMLQQFLEPKLLQDGILDTVIFQQDGAPCHYAKIVQDYLNVHFHNRWIGRGGPHSWSARSPDLTPLDFFAWGFIKSQVYRRKIRDLADLRNRITEAIQMITPEILERVFRETLHRLELCRDINGRHVENNI